MEDGYEQERAIWGHLRYESWFLVRFLFSEYESSTLTRFLALE